ncbi:hypothetical protein [Pontibacter amylolyticus]|uniref:Secreted protein n=1 Tax=Pontibacter amylolyticus TaxID=1424080 RepID=A0ABQ1WGK1_9BACT|nr:hypothetical protein [Pontibacter amylolyticus]GGG28743.1 hypothetical protein GCM10011323_35190 [Pontibacter amylolyticus]
MAAPRFFLQAACMPPLFACFSDKEEGQSTLSPEKPKPYGTGYTCHLAQHTLKRKEPESTAFAAAPGLIFN